MGNCTNCSLSILFQPRPSTTTRDLDTHLLSPEYTYLACMSNNMSNYSAIPGEGDVAFAPEFTSQNAGYIPLDHDSRHGFSARQELEIERLYTPPRTASPRPITRKPVRNSSTTVSASSRDVTQANMVPLCSDASGDERQNYRHDSGHTPPANERFEESSMNFEGVPPDEESHLDIRDHSVAPIMREHAPGHHNVHGQSGPPPTVQHGHIPPTSHSPSSPVSLSRQKQPRLYRVWLWEIAACVAGLACMASVAGVLVYENGRRLDQWSLHIGQKHLSPTVVVSFIGTLGKSACLFVLAAIISQLKWLHFEERPQRLVDLQLFDDASRGPWGASQLAFVKNRKTLLASCTCVLVLASLLVDPFIQAVFSLPVILTPVQGASPSILTSSVYDPSAWDARNGQCYGGGGVDSVLQAAILSPIWNATRTPSLPCGFERCEWPTITTLGVCSSCVDVTDTVIPNCVGNSTSRYKAVDCNYTVPSSGIQFNAVFGSTGGAAETVPYGTIWNSVAGTEWSSTLGRAVNWYDPTSFNASRTVISNFTSVKFADTINWMTILNMDNSLKSVPQVEQAMECRLELCARTFTTPSYANFSGSPLAGPKTNLITARNGTKIPYVGGSRVLLDLEAAAASPKDQPPPAAGTAPTFQINYCDYDNLGEYLRDLFTTTMSTNGVMASTDDASTGGRQHRRGPAHHAGPGSGLQPDRRPRGAHARHRRQHDRGPAHLAQQHGRAGAGHEQRDLHRHRVALAGASRVPGRRDLACARHRHGPHSGARGGRLEVLELGSVVSRAGRLGQARRGSEGPRRDGEYG